MTGPHAAARVRAVRRPDRDGGVTLVEVVLGGLLLAVVLAAATTAVTRAANLRAGIDQVDLGSEIANDVLLRAEAYGCGLPIGYGDVVPADRLALCSYDTAPGASGLADVDYVAVRGERRFAVALRMEWNLLEPPPSTYMSSAGACRRQASYASGVASTPPSAASDPARAAHPTVLTRTVEVNTDSGRTVTLTSRQAVLPHLADPDAVLGLMAHAGGLDGEAVTLSTVIGGATHSYRLHGDSDDCAWFPFLTSRDYTLEIAGASTRSFLPLTCPSGATGICHRHSS